MTQGEKTKLVLPVNQQERQGLLAVNLGNWPRSVLVWFVRHEALQ